MKIIAIGDIHGRDDLETSITYIDVLSVSDTFYEIDI